MTHNQFHVLIAFQQQFDDQSLTCALSFPRLQLCCKSVSRSSFKFVDIVPLGRYIHQEGLQRHVVNSMVLCLTLFFKTVAHSVEAQHLLQRSELHHDPNLYRHTKRIGQHARGGRLVFTPRPAKCSLRLLEKHTIRSIGEG